ncbi:helix-turn-helix domain-containing protein [Methylobrevis albus]|uniref:Helix-turn-helix domain-containing protein n=1 Tax=Methylobrevis albus TaxID=2793297 RepID=A0A931I590_9HYPH|nr:helix-turn-helix domain-containing protein [Methylobrevis albus]MBH0239068.1 helix-turn-helix domain-containing protein [Methylobrevis albus]
MDAARNFWHFPDMPSIAPPLRDDPHAIPAWNLYGESRAFPDVLHIETITDRAAGLDWRIAPHRHPHLHQFFLIRAGAVELTIDGAVPAVSPPVLLSVPHGVVHGFAFSAGTEGWVLTVPLPSLPDLLEPTVLRETALGRAGLLPVDADLVRLFERIAAEHRRTEPARAMMLRALATDVACRVLRHLGRAPGAAGAATDPRLRQFQALLGQHLRDRWKLADFARTIGVSERHLSRICRAATGRPAGELIEAAVMREACRMLVYTRGSVAAIGYGLGFEDPSYFSRAFRRVMGLSPGAYRAGFERGEP